jgi:iron complex outermembrane receptor protein
MSRSLSITCGLPLLIAVAAGGASYAQTTAPDAASAAASAAVGEIVVTAQKRVERLQDVPVTVSAVSGAALAQAGVKDLFEAVTLVPGMVFSRAPDDGIALTFRGLGTVTRSAELEQSIALVEDGVPLAKGRLYSTAFFDVNQMEFIKGSEATLFGKNSSLGAINVEDRQPGERPAFEGSAGYEAVDGGYTIDAAADIPLSPKVQTRLAFHDNDLDGWVHNDATNHNGPEQKDLGFRAMLRAEPNDRLTLTAMYQYADNAQIGYSMQLVGDIPASEGDGVLNDRTDEYTSLTANHDSLHHTRTDIASFKADWRAGADTLTSQTSLIHYDLYYVDDLDFSPDNTVAFVRKERYDQVAQEFRLSSPTGGRIDYQAGLFYLGSHWKSSEDQHWAVPAFPPPPDPTSGQLFNGPFTNLFTEDTSTYSAYASGDWRILDKLTLAGGVRYSHIEKDADYGRFNAAPLTIWNTIANPPFDLTPLKHSANFFDGNASLRYQLSHDVMAYVSYGHGGKAGGYVETNTISVPPAALVNGKVPAALVAANAALKDEIAQTFEGGVKTLLFDRTVRLNLAAFRTDIRNFQDTVFTGGSLGFITFNEPARSYGAEADGAWNVGHGLELNGGFTYAEATNVIQPIDPATGAPEVNAAGQPIYRRYQRSQAPKWIYNLGAAYKRRLADDLDLQLTANLHHRGGMFNQRQEEYNSQPLTTLDLGAGLGPANGPWRLNISARNVANAISQDFASAPPDPRFAAFYGAYGASPNRLRTVLISVEMKY